MMRLTLSSPVTEISHIGRSVEKQLKHLGILTVQDLLFYFPARYDDLSQITPIKQARVGQRVVVRGRIELIESTRSRWRHKLLTNAVVADQSGAVRVVWFNQPWIAKMFKSGEELYLVGELKDDGSGAYFASPAYEKVGKGAATHAGRIVPVYPATEKLSQKQIRFLVKRALPLARVVEDTLSYEVRGQYHLIPLAQALTLVHFPPNYERLEQAQRRLKFDELLRLQLLALSLKSELKKIPAPVVEFHEQETKKFVDSLPFKLTDDQRRAAWEILQDIGRPRPMNRLLEGEVGSGKTVVVAIAALNAVGGVHNPPQPSLILREGDRSIPPLRVRGGLPAGQAGEEGLRGQVAIMAPTEILARQHFRTFSKFLEPHGVSVELRVGGANGKKGAVKGDVIVGTHALIQKNVQFNNLVLAVVDEQHRFGVEQRQALKTKREDGLMPHLLSLTATPIPRSLALVFYGDLDISILKEMPKGRQRIETVLVTDKSLALSDVTKLSFNRVQAYDFVRGEIAKGHQVFWTCPIIDPSDTLGVSAATEVFENLRNEVFPDLRVGLLHGRMKSKEREKVMQEFVGLHGRHSEEPQGDEESRALKNGIPRLAMLARDDKRQAIDILVATPVIEVGIDVPNATVMVIEGAERFGLAQLHQFRGRVGRGEAQSYCLLMVDTLPPPLTPPRAGGEKSVSSPLGGEVRRGAARLKAFLESNDGFALAERDLELRGPGEIYGKAQSGFPEFRIASFADVDIAKEAKQAAQWILAQDPELARYPQLKKAAIDREKVVHLE